MTEKFTQNGWGKEILKIAAGATIALVPGIFAYGSLSANSTETTRRLQEHVEVYTPRVYGEFVGTQRDVEALKIENTHLKETLKELKDQNAEILRILRRTQ